jgi:hypothetical protein
MSVTAQYVILFYYFRRFLEEAAARKIDVAPLKGAHLLTSVYPEGEDRGPMADVDFLVRPEDWEKTFEILSKMGFVQKTLPGRRATSDEFYEAGFYLSISDRERILFEPHRFLVQPRRLSIDYNALWARASASTFDGAPCRRLCTEDHILHAAVHLTTHFFNLGKRWIKDLALLFSNGKPDFDVLASRAFAWRVQRAAWLAFSLLDEADSSLGLTALCRRLAPAASVHRLLRFLVPESSGFRFSNAGLRLSEAIFWPAIFDQTSDLARFAAYYANLRLRDFFVKE